MLKFRLSAVAALLACLVVLGQVLPAQDGGEETAALTNEVAAQEWAGKGAPGEIHAKLAEHAGTWDVTVTLFDKDAEGQPVAIAECKGQSTFEMTLNGRFLRQTCWCDMGPMGRMEGVGYLGYNSDAGQYESVWMDNMSTAMMRGTGYFNEADQEFVETAQLYLAKTDGFVTIKNTFKHREDGSMLMVMREMREGNPWAKKMEIVYTRPGGAPAAPAAAPAQ
jgi:hypothetical protein